MSWRATFGLRAVRVYLVLSGLVAIGCAIQPLFAVMGPELAVALGLALPIFVAPTSARVVIAARRAESPLDGRALTQRVLVVSLAGLAIPWLAAVASGLLYGFCDATGGALFMLLGPAIGVPLAALASAAAASLTARPRIATLLATLVPLVSIVVGLWRFVETPAIFAYTHFVGYFPGTLYDPDIAIEGAYWSLRLASLALFVTLALVMDVAFDGRVLVASRMKRAPIAASTIALLSITLLFVEIYGPELGHRSTSASIAEVLGGRLDGERCTVLVPRELPRAQAERLRDDCDYRVSRAEAVLGVTQRARVTAFFFRDTSEKRRLMGASNTYIAKPWRNEVYLQLGGWPHPVLFHEIVHVVAGNVGRGPFRVSGGIEGLIPSPGIIEGVAVAVAWDEREGLTPHQWARALVEIGHAPSIAETEGLGFLLQPASRAYTASGSFVRWILETRGNEAVRRLYRTGSYEEALGMPLSDAEAEWREFLTTVPLPPHAIAMARLRFERPAIFGQICPHAIASLEADLGIALAGGDDTRALERCDRILALDEGQAGVRSVRVGVLGRAARFEEAEAELAHLVGPPSAATPVLVHTREALGDAYWRHGDRERAHLLYSENLALPQPEDQRRQIEVRIYALTQGGETSAALRELLAPDARNAVDPGTQLAAIARLDRVDPSGLGAYLTARQMFVRERFDLVLPLLDRANAQRLPTESILREAERMRAVTLFASGDLDASDRAFRAILADARTQEGDVGRLVEAEDWLARIRWTRRTP
ncbi:MAG: hypothetical protein J0L92_07420 [Deltaproteobacteria bacterium]|nr:hypothetical protein [Deltaproteobacteria bacterium]